jgi:hypothetical protein
MRGPPPPAPMDSPRSSGYRRIASIFGTPADATLRGIFAWLVPIAVFWVIVSIRIPYSISRALSTYSTGLLVLVLICYCLAFRGRGVRATVLGLGLTMLLFGLSISFFWSSGNTDTGMIGGLLPYKDAKNYYFGALQMLNGLPVRAGIQAVRRPLFSGLMASLLWLTAGNLKVVIALLGQMAGISLYCSARVVRNSLGPWAAGLFACLMYFYIQPRVGYAVSEIGGFVLGCWGFSIIWTSASRRSLTGLALGIGTLMAAVSARAGAFFVFPAMVVWAGWVFRGAGRFSIKTAGVFAVIIVLAYLLVNQAFSALLDVRLSDQWGSFAYAMYGQVHGGSGWHSAIDELHTTQTSVVANAALRFFLDHPLSFLIASAKSYRDFFLPGPFMIFSFGAGNEPPWLTYLLWSATVGLLCAGLGRSLQNLRSELPSLLAACFAGTFLSIPFLPPIDSGARFHAASIGFFFALPAAAVSTQAKWLQARAPANEQPHTRMRVMPAIASVLLILTLILPVLIYRLTPRPEVARPICQAGKHPFVLRASPQTYVDVLPRSAGPCGLAPRICVTDFESHATDQSNDDFVQELLSLAHKTPDGIRIIPTINLLDARFHHFVSPQRGGLPVPAGQLVSGCASEIFTLNGSLYSVENAGMPAGGE